MRKFSYEGLMKLAGPSPRDKASARVPGASLKLKQQQLATAYRKAHPSALGSTNEQKAYLRQQGQKALSRATPEQQAKFWNDMAKFQGNVARGRGFLASFMPGVGLVGGAVATGLGEASASGIEGKGVGKSLGRGAVVGGASYGLGKGVEAVGRHVVAPAYRWAAPRVRNFMQDGWKTVPQVDPSWAGDQVHKAALRAARKAEPGPFGKIKSRLLFRDPMKPAVDAAADVYADDAYLAWRSAMDDGLGEVERVHDYLRRQGFDISNPKVQKIVDIRRRYPEISRAKDLRLSKALERQRLIGKDEVLKRGLDSSGRVLYTVGPRSPVPYGEPGYGFTTGIFEVTPRNARLALAENARAYAHEFEPRTYFNHIAQQARGRPLPKGKWFSHDSLMRDLQNEGDFLFKGSPEWRYESNLGSADGDFWYTHNPYVAEGYGLGTERYGGGVRRGVFTATPLSEKGAITPAAAEKRFTPHIGTGDPSEIAKASREAIAQEAAELKTSRAAGGGDWGNDRHYEIVLHGAENRVARDTGRHFLLFPGKTQVNNSVVARGPTTGHGDTAHFLELPREDIASYLGNTDPDYETVRRSVQYGDTYPTRLFNTVR